MLFRESIPEDVLYMAEHSINQKCDRKQEETIDYTYTLESNGKPIAVGGFRMITSTTCWSWVDLAPEAIVNIRSVFRVLKEWADSFCKQHGIKRMQAFIRQDQPKNIRLVEHLGYTYESTMPYFFGDESALLFSRII